MTSNWSSYKTVVTVLSWFVHTNVVLVLVSCIRKIWGPFFNIEPIHEHRELHFTFPVSITGKQEKLPLRPCGGFQIPTTENGQARCRLDRDSWSRGALAGYPPCWSAPRPVHLATQPAECGAHARPGPLCDSRLDQPATLHCSSGSSLVLPRFAGAM